MTGPERQKLNLRRNKSKPLPAHQSQAWRVLVVDDDQQVHVMTDLLFQDYTFEGGGFQAIHAYSAAEAIEILTQDSTIPIALVDVVMEQPDAGLRLVQKIRHDLNNLAIRIILRTGQPGEAPERNVVLDYDVNDYKAKTELTSQKLFTALVGALRAWRDIQQAAQLAAELSEANATLERKVEERTKDLTTALTRVNEAKRDLRQFLSMMSHEFRTPLAIIDSAAQMLMIRKDDRREAALPRLEAIRGGVDRLVNLIDTCLADDRLEAETIELKAEITNIAPLIHAALAQQRQAHPDRAIHLTMPFLPDVKIDMGLMAMAINNLLNNALKYSTSDIELTVTVHPNHILIAITDHGIGIPADALDYVFDRFYRADNVKGMAGTGIGLHMCQRIIALHGGTLSAVSAEGKGSTFTMRLNTGATA